jgi:hypothetical protein
MNELFNRVASLVVGKNSLEGKRFSGMRITFEIEKNSESTANPAKVSIYNLSHTSRAELEATDNVMILEAGYSGLPETGTGTNLTSVLFSGDISKVITVRRGPDLITTLEAGDAEKKLRTTHIDQSFAEFASAAQVINTLANKFQLTIGSIMDIGTDIFKSGLSLSGLVSDNLDLITKKMGLEWHVQDGELHIMKPDKSTLETAVLLNKDTGLVGIPSKTEKGVEFTSLLNTQIRPGRAVQLQSELISGLFRVRRAKYQGDTAGGSWTVSVEAV